MPDEINLKDIANKIDGMDKRFDRVEKSIEDLATITKAEFEKIDGRFEKIDEKFEKADARFDNVDRSMEEIKMKFAYTAWAIDLKDLERRVKLLEDKS
jgi:hypothetical protein